MNDLRTNVNLPLLYEVRKHALTQSRDVVFGEGLFSVMHYMMKLVPIARKEGLTALEETVQVISSDICFYQDIQTAIFEICDGTDAEDLIEMLTSRYWSKDLKGEDAMIYYLIILSAVRIQDGVSEWQLEQLLMACFFEDNIAAYDAYRKRQKDMENKPDALEILLSQEPNIGEGGILVVRGLLEEKIQKASDAQLRKVIRAAKENDFIITLRGLSVCAKRKLLSVVQRQKAYEYAQDCQYFGPVRQIDALQAFAEMIAVFGK